MKRIILFLILMAGLGSQAATTSTNVVATVTFTNVVAGVTNGDTITINGDTRRYTNGTLADASVWIQSTNIVGWAATNTWYHLGATTPSGVDLILANGTNAIDIRGMFSSNLTVTLSSGIGTVAYVTNVFQPVRPLLLPIDGLLVASTRTNAQERLVEALNLSYSTGVVVSAATIMTNFVNLFASQTLSNKLLILAALEQATITNAATISGTLGYLTNGALHGVTITNGTFVGILGALTNGYSTNLVLDSPIMTNGVNYGNAFSSPGSGSNSEEYGSGATATGNNTVALGVNANATATDAIAIGNGAQGTGIGDVVIGGGAEGGYGNGIVIGTSAAVNATNGIAIGNGAIVSANDTNSIAIGNGVTTTKTNQVLLGTSTHLVEVPGRFLVSGTMTNATRTGAQRFGVTGGPYSTVAIARRNVTTMAAGANQLDIAGASYVKVSGSGGSAFSIDGITNSTDGLTDGQLLYIDNKSGATLTIAHESGLALAAGNRIDTTTDRGEVFTTNGIAQLIYDSAASRWTLMNPPLSSRTYGSLMTYSNTLNLDIATANTYYVLTNLQTAGLSSGLTVDTSNSRIQVSAGGVYKVDFFISFSGTANQTFTCSGFTNGVRSQSLNLVRKLGTGGDVGSAAFAGIVYMPTNCLLDIRVQSDSDTDTITPTYAGLSVVKMD